MFKEKENVSMIKRKQAKVIYDYHAGLTEQKESFGIEKKKTKKYTYNFKINKKESINAFQ